MLKKTSQLEQRDAFLQAMSNVANSVTVVTTDGPGGLHGATVSSFCSVSADPPTLLVCLNKVGRTAGAIQTNQTFCVNVLPESGVETAKRFAGLTDTPEDDLFKSGNWKIEPGTLPTRNGATSFVCNVIETVDSTSHFIFIGEVERISAGEEKPLIYLDRKFGTTIPL